MIDWQAVQAVAELVAALGVIVSLLYVAAQVRQNTASVRSAASRAAADHLASTNMAVVGNWPLLDAMVKAMHGPLSALSEPERLALDVYLNGFLRHHEDLYMQHLEGLIDERVFETHVGHLRLALAGGWVGEHWQRTRELYSVSFRSWIDDLAAAASDETAVAVLQPAGASHRAR